MVYNNNSQFSMFKKSLLQSHFLDDEADASDGFLNEEGLSDYERRERYAQEKRKERDEREADKEEIEWDDPTCGGFVVDDISEEEESRDDRRRFHVRQRIREEGTIDFNSTETQPLEQEVSLAQAQSRSSMTFVTSRLPTRALTSPVLTQ